VSMFLAPWRQPVMHSPHSVHPRRRGPTPPKYGSSTSTPGSPKNTPTGARWKVSPTPIRSATFRMTSSAGVMDGLTTAPSIRLAWS